MNITPGSNIGVDNERVEAGKRKGEERGGGRVLIMYTRACTCACERARGHGFSPEISQTKKTIAPRAQSLYRASSELNPKLFAGKANTGIPP